MKRPVFCLRKTLYPKPLNFFLKKLISLSPLKGNRAFTKKVLLHFYFLQQHLKIIRIILFYTEQGKMTAF